MPKKIRYTSGVKGSALRHFVEVKPKKKQKEWCVHLEDGQGNVIQEFEDIQANSEPFAIKEARERYLADISFCAYVVCQGCHTDNDPENKKCESCEKKL